MKKIQQAPLREQVAAAIRKAILTRELCPGDKVSEQELADRLGVSRLPVREAIRILERQGLVVSQPHSGTYIASISREEGHDAQFVRAALEELAVQQAIERLDSQQWNSLCTELRQFVDEMRNATAREEPLTVVELDLAFHNVLINAARNRTLSHAWQVAGLPLRVWSLDVRYGAVAESWPLSVDHHEDLLAVLRVGDVEACREAVRFHVLRRVL